MDLAPTRREGPGTIPLDAPEALLHIDWPDRLLYPSVREATGSSALWQFRTKDGILATGLSAGVASSAARSFVSTHRLTDAGKPVDLRLSRLRKTHKAAVYKVTGGRMSAFVQGHSPDVAVAHYADIPSLRALHEQAVADGLQDALVDAQTPAILTPEEEERLTQRPTDAVELLGIPAEQLPPLLSGESDLWLSSCRSFFDSPFGVKGKPCPVSFFACLGCSNAVITRRKLPAILAFLNHIETERAKTPAAEVSIMTPFCPRARWLPPSFCSKPARLTRWAHCALR